jgi:hypothetical protein
MDEEKVTISKKEYHELMNIKMRYHCVIGLNTIKTISSAPFPTQPRRTLSTSVTISGTI